MQEIKTNINALALMNVQVDFNEFLIRILEGLDSRYNCLANSIQSCENPIAFDELLEKLLNHEANLKTIPLTINVPRPAMTMAALVRQPKN